MKKALVLNSGGVDSTTCVAIAIKEYGNDNVATVSVFYGQKHEREVLSARKIADYYKIKHYEIDLTEIYKYSECTLLKSRKKLEEKTYAEQVKESKHSHISSCVPFRNGVMVSAVTALAGSLFPKEKVDIFLGALGSDFAYADCSKQFLDEMQKAVERGTYGDVSLKTPLATMTKAQVVAVGLALKVPYELTWSCYNGGEKPCGKCATCLDRAEAFQANGVKDPLMEE